MIEQRRWKDDYQPKKAFVMRGKKLAERRVKYERALDGGFDLQTRQKLFFARHHNEERRLVPHAAIGFFKPDSTSRIF